MAAGARPRGGGRGGRGWGGGWWEVEVKKLMAAGAGPRGVAMRVRAARVHAWLEGRAAIVPEDLRTVFVDTIAPRLALQPVYEAQRAEIARPLAAEILRRVAAP